MKKLSLLLTLIFTFSACSSSSESNAKKHVQQSMKEFVKEQTHSDGTMPVLYKGKVLKLEVRTSKKYPDGFHSGVKNHGDIYTSCADFIDPKTKDKFDIDFLVKKTGERYSVVQPFVHSKNGIKNPYDLH